MPLVPWDKLTPKQKQVIQHKSGSLLVLSGPGTGKTEILTQRITYLVNNVGVNPNDILAITFSNKAKDEMIKRMKESRGLESTNFNIFTLHGLALKMLVDMNQNRKFIATDDDNILILSDALNQIHPKYTYGDCMFFLESINHNKWNCIYPNECEDQLIQEIYIKYEELLKFNNIHDINGLILYFLKIAKKNIRFILKHILIDEYQDINRSEYEFIKFISLNSESLFVVGDDDQSIYGWRGADPSIIMEFETAFEKTKYETIEETRRVPPLILEGALEIVDKVQNRKKKNLKSVVKSNAKIQILFSKDEEQEAKWISTTISELLELKVVKPHEVAILAKELNLAEKVNRELKDKNIKTKYWKKNELFSSNIVETIISILRVVSDRDDNLAIRKTLSNTSGFNIGKKKLEILNSLSIKHNINIWSVLIHSNKYVESRRWKKDYDGFIEFINSLEKKYNLISVYKIVEVISNKLGYEKDPIINVLKSYILKLPPRMSLNQFIRKFTEKAGMDFNKDLSLDNENQKSVNIMSIHSSKGLGFKIVFLLGMGENILPNYDQDIDEQRRLCYVAMTRTKQKLYMCYCSEITGPTAQGFSQYDPSLFLQELPKSCYEIIDIRGEVLKKNVGSDEFTEYEP